MMELTERGRAINYGCHSPERFNEYINVSCVYGDIEIETGIVRVAFILSRLRLLFLR